jgi:hypothetical protein
MKRRAGPRGVYLIRYVARPPVLSALDVIKGTTVAEIEHHGVIDTGEVFGASIGLRRHGIWHV